eukprot:scaffold147955_cov18-Tisochrysis_lutea.AAC.1
MVHFCCGPSSHCFVDLGPFSGIGQCAQPLDVSLISQEQSFHVQSGMVMGVHGQNKNRQAQLFKCAIFFHCNNFACFKTSRQAAGMLQITNNTDDLLMHRGMYSCL